MAGLKKSRNSGENLVSRINSISSTKLNGESTSANELEASGEVYFPYDQPDPGNHARVGAIVDGLRKIAILQTFGESSVGLPDTVTCQFRWGDLHLDVRSISRKGILLSDEVILTLEDSVATCDTWRISNLRLVEPNVQQDVQIDVLTDVLKTLGFVLIESHRVGRDIWQETIRWAKVSE